MQEFSIPVRSEGRWFGTGHGASYGTLFRRAGSVDLDGVLMLPPLGYAWWSSYVTRRALGEELAQAGHTVLALDYHGTGDAPGSPWHLDQPDACRRSVDAGARELGELGCTTLTLIGVEHGGSMALTLADRVGADRVIAWEPVVSGRRAARGLTVRSLGAPDGEHVCHGGTVFGRSLLETLRGFDLLSVACAPARVLLIAGADAAPVADHLRDLGSEVTRVESADGEQALHAAAEDAVVAGDVVDAAAAWLGAGRGGSAAPATTGVVNATRIPWRTGTVEESALRIGGSGLFAIRCGPTSKLALPGSVILLNSGSESHVGPGRAWVELSRELALDGLRTLRADFRGWGESPGAGSAPGRPYDAHAIADTLEIVGELESRGEGPVVLVGLCAGAWIGLRAILDHPVAGVVALNPQLYWEPGDPVEALLSETRRRRAPERERERAGRESGEWDQRDRRGERNRAGAWLDRLAAGSTAVSLVFAEGDDGLEYLRNRLALRLADACAGGRVRVREVPGIDHAMHRAWLRPMMFGAIRDAARDALTAAAGGED